MLRGQHVEGRQTDRRERQRLARSGEDQRSDQRNDRRRHTEDQRRHAGRESDATDHRRRPRADPISEATAERRQHDAWQGEHRQHDPRHEAGAEDDRQRQQCSVHRQVGERDGRVRRSERAHAEQPQR